MATEKFRSKIIKTFIGLLSDEKWEDVSLVKVAEKAEVSLSDLRGAFDGKIAIIAAFCAKIDQEVLKSIDEDIEDELPRERLMDVLLSRFDALAPHKNAVRAIEKAARADLSVAAQLNRISLISMTWMLNAARIDTSRMDGAVRVQGAALVFGKVLRVWLDDDASMAKTMSALDKELRRGERTMRRLDRLGSVLSPLMRLKTLRSARPVQATTEEELSI